MNNSGKNYDVIIIGGGIIGCSTAMQLIQTHPDLKILILEKEGKIAQHQTGHNSGVIHAGVYYTPGSLKAKFCRQGCEQSKQFCEQHKIPYQVPGKLIVAVTEQEIPWLHNLADRCRQNQLTVTSLTSDEIKKKQPGIHALAGFWVHETGIVSWPVVCQKYLDLFMQQGGEILYGQTITAINESATHVTVTAAGQNYQCGRLICCAGLQSDRLVRLAGLKPEFKIIPFRGEYYQLSPALGKTITQCIYPVPNPNLPFLGIHFTPQMSGITTIGPNALLSLSRESYRWYNINVRDAIETLTYHGFWKLLLRQLGPTWHELSGSLFKNVYLKRAKQYLPAMTYDDLKAYPAGIRAQAMYNSGELIDDFLFVETDRMIHVCNAPSPAATSSLPIGNNIVSRIK